MPDIDDRYSNPWAEWENLSFQGYDEVPSAIAATFFTGESNNPAQIVPVVGIIYAQDDRHSLYFPKFQNAEIPPAPTVGDPQLELVSPPEADGIRPTDLIVVRYSNLEDIDVGTLALYVTFCLPTDEDDQLIETRECLLIHDGASFRFIFNDNASEVYEYTDAGRNYVQYTIRNIRGWPVGLKTRFEARGTDGTGASL